MKFIYYIWPLLALIPWNNLMSQDPVKPGGTREITSLSPYFSDLQHDYDVKFYFIDLEISNTSTYIKGQTSILVETLTDITDTLAFELSSSLSIDSVLVNSIPITSFLFSDNLLKIVLPEELKKMLHLTARIHYRGNAGIGGFFGGVRTGKEHKYDKWVTFTLSEPYQSHTWFPCKQDLADKADSAWIFLTVDNNLKAGSNGLLTKQTPIGNDKTRYEWKTHYPVTYYLISFSVADYIDYTFYVNIPGTNHNMPVQNYLYNHPSILQAEKEKIDKTKDILLLYSELLGTYPFYLEKYGHCLAPMGGGMEHQTMTTLTHFNFALVAHELAHQWFGNSVTCKTWQDIWINEGFASYLEYVAIEKLRTEEEAKAWMGQAQSSSVLFPEGSVFIDEVDVRKVDRIFSMELSYKKGAVILHMLRFEMADDALFFSILKGFLSEYASGVASGDDFINYVNHITGLDYTWFLNQWYYGKGYPLFFTTWKQTKDSLIINSIQEGSSTETPFFRTHMDYKLVFEDGSHERIRVNYLQNEERFAVSAGKTIDYIAADPDNAILKSSIVIKQMAPNKLFEVNPNPFTDTLIIRFKNPNEKRIIRLSSLSGKVIFESDSPNGIFSEDMTSLRPGIYILTVTEGMNDYSVKLVKTNPKEL